jgi:hypothetical protein
MDCNTFTNGLVVLASFVVLVATEADEEDVTRWAATRSALALESMTANACAAILIRASHWQAVRRS